MKKNVLILMALLISSTMSFAMSWDESTKTLTVTENIPDYWNYSSEGSNYLEKVENVVIAEGVTYIGVQAFYKCTSLSSITISSTVETIETMAFGYCLIQSENFKNNSSLDAASNHYWGAYVYDTHENKMYIKENKILKADSDITTADIPNTIEVIGEEAFLDCTYLTSITIPSSVKEIGYHAFSGCYILESNFVNNSTDINPKFNNYWGANICDVIENGLCIKGTSLLKAYPNITSAVIPENIETICELAFYNCYNLPSITIPNNVKAIETQAFISCTGLTTVNIGTNVTSIGYEAFRECTNLTTVTCWATSVPKIKTHVFMVWSNEAKNYIVNPKTTIYVLSELENEYKSAENWSEYASIIKSIDPTGIEKVVNHESETEQIYDLQGRRIIKPTKGLYIVNGKKVFVK